MGEEKTVGVGQLGHLVDLTTGKDGTWQTDGGGGASTGCGVLAVASWFFASGVRHVGGGSATAAHAARHVITERWEIRRYRARDVRKVGLTFPSEHCR
jgi:hypothetical protein